MPITKQHSNKRKATPAFAIKAGYCCLFWYLAMALQMPTLIAASETEIERDIVNFGFSVWSVKSEAEAEKEFVPCGPMEPVALVEYAKSPGEEDVVTYVPAIYLRHMEMVNRDENMKEFFVLAAKITATLSSAGLVYRGATAVQKIIGIVELANTITNEVLKDPTVRARIAARPNGLAFLEAWPTISTVADLATISVSTLDLFSKSGKQILADCYDNIPEAERLYIKSKIDDCEKAIIKSVDKLPPQVKNIVSNFENEATKAKFISDYFDEGAEAFRKAVGDKPELVESWKILNETGIEGLAGKVDNIEIVDDFVKKYPDKIDDFVAEI